MVISGSRIGELFGYVLYLALGIIRFVIDLLGIEGRDGLFLL